MREMKDSVIEWIGKIPAIWNEVPIRFVFKECTTKNVLLQEKMALKFTYGNIIPKQDFDADTDEYVANTIANYTVVHPGVIMINCLNLNYDFVSKRVGLVKDNGAITSAYLAIEPTDKVIPEYATYQLKSWDAVKAFHNMGTGVRKTLDFSELGKKHFVVPPLVEQHRIAAFLDSKCSELDALSADIQKEIEILEQYKRSVITEAVTKGLNPDVKMKDSGIRHIGKIPANWKSVKIKYLAKERSENGLFNPEKDHYIGLENVASYSNSLIKTETEYTESLQNKVYRGDVMFSRLRPYLAKVIIAPFDCFSTGEFLQLYGYTGDKRYLRYNMLSVDFIKEVNMSTYGAKMPRANSEFIINLKIPQPPVAEQKQIADFLDSKCKEVESAMADKKHQLEVIDSYKKSLIYEYVTGKKEVPATN